MRHHSAVSTKPGHTDAQEGICEGKRGARAGAVKPTRRSLPGEIGLAGQVAEVNAVAVLHAPVPVAVSAVGPAAAWGGTQGGHSPEGPGRGRPGRTTWPQGLSSLARPSTGVQTPVLRKGGTGPGPGRCASADSPPQPPCPCPSLGPGRCPPSRDHCWFPHGKGRETAGPGLSDGLGGGGGGGGGGSLQVTLRPPEARPCLPPALFSPEGRRREFEPSSLQGCLSQQGLETLRRSFLLCHLHEGPGACGQSRPARNRGPEPSGEEQLPGEAAALPPCPTAPLLPPSSWLARDPRWAPTCSRPWTGARLLTTGRSHAGKGHEAPTAPDRPCDVGSQDLKASAIHACHT